MYIKKVIFNLIKKIGSEHNIPVHDVRENKPGQFDKDFVCAGCGGSTILGYCDQCDGDFEID